MQCTRPIHGYYARRANRMEGGRPVRSVVFRQSDGFTDKPVSLPCGKCLGCRMEYARQWAVRCEHEIKVHDTSCFITLTYDDKSVPYSPSGLMSLSLRDVTLFWKRLRKALHPRKVRFFQCGEYGGKTQRPHYHALVFGWYPHDRVYHGDSGSGERLYTSKFLDDVWGYGLVTAQDATWRTANYVARYITKKLVNPDDGSDDRRREFLTMSRKPGIGNAWATEHLEEWFSRDEMVSNGVAMRPPKYYEGILKERAPQLLSYVKSQRRKVAAEVEFKRVTDSKVTHHAVEVVREAKLRTLTRDGVE